MPFLASTRKTAARLVTVVTATVAFGAIALSTGAAPAISAARTMYAAPGPLSAAPGDIDEGGSASLREQLEAATKGYLDAKAALGNSTERQKKLTAHITALEAELTTRSERIGELAGLAYRTGRLGAVSALLNSRTPEGFLDRMAALGTVAANEDRELRGLRETRDQETRAKAAVEQEIREQRKQVEIMDKRRQQAERALTLAGSGGPSAGVNAGASTPGSTGGSTGGTKSVSAKPAPRNSNGSWPSESCSINDPTTSGCITPRTLHALNQAKAAGFTRYVSCYRSGGSGEHPKGRACDFAAQKGGFGGVATGGDRTYGNNLAAYFVKNASQLGVLYVIWFKQIWLPSSGWKAYNGGGDPSSDHTNHVHLSVY